MRRILLLLVLTVNVSAATFKADDGVTLHYDVIGKGSPVLLLSGGPGFSPEYLAPIAEKLGARHQFILLHQRGTGRSVLEKYDATTIALKQLVADLDALRRELKVEKLTIVGHSWGGILSMMYASEHPDRIAALALIDSGGPTLSGVPKFAANLMSRFTAEDNARIAEWTAPEKMNGNRKKAILEVTKAKTGAYFHDRSKAHLLTDPMTEASFHDGVFYAVTGQLMTGLDLRAGLKNLKAPVLVLHGKQDPLETAQEVHEAIAGSRLEIIEEAGHFPWLEKPDEVYGVLGEFLGESSSRRVD